MPKCIITKCPHRTGGKPTTPTVTLHGFPNSIERIKEWLLQTGQSFQHLDELADIILEGKRCDLYRMCSTHFVEDSYVNTGKRKKLKRTAVPTIFPEPADGRLLIEELHIIESKNKENQTDAEVCFLCGMSPSGSSIKKMHDQSTQTEFDIWGPAVPPVQHIYLLAHTSPITESTKSEEMACNYNAHMAFEGSSNQENVRALLINPLNSFIELGVPQPPSQIDQHPEGSIISFTVGGGSRVEKNEDQRPDRNYTCFQENIHSFKANVQQSLLVDEHFNSNPNAVGDPIADMVNESKYIVFDQCLDNLLHKVKCQDPIGCSKVVHKYNKEFHGSAVIIRGSCEDGHHFRIWESQPKINRHYAGNVLLAASLLTTGQNFQQIQALFKNFGVRYISEEKFNQYQNRFIFPSIHNAWKAQHDQTQNSFKDTPVAICGRGQFDSPGDKTKFCVYTMKDLISDKILDLEVVQRTQCTSFMEMESHGLDTCMSRAISNGQDIVFFASEKKMNVQKLMRTKYKNINHQYDVRLYAKRLKSKLIFAAHGHTGISIKPWISKILKHFWWSIQTSKGNATLLKEKWLSLLRHIQNIHTWNDGELYHKCAHAALSEEACAGILWLKEDTLAYKKVSEIICNHKILEDLDHLVWNCHTGKLDLSKFYHEHTPFSIDAMEATARLAAICHNTNIDRMPSVVLRSMANTDTRSKLILPKRRKKRLLHTINEPVTNMHLMPILQDTLRIAEGSKSSTWVPKGTLIRTNLVKIEKPDKSELAATQFSSFIYRKKRTKSDQEYLVQ